MSQTSLESIFFAALERPPGERGAYLDGACGGDAELRACLERMLAAQPDLGEFLDRPHPVAAEALRASGAIQPPVDHSGAVIAGKYKLLEQIGEGGMGTVWMAEQTLPVRRKVALKLIKPGMDSKAVLARFEAERQALAVMDHPNIARVLDGGTTESGRPYFVMEYVKGVPITHYCDEARLRIDERLALFVVVCRAVQHAHQKGIIHRDLKPSNVLVCPYDGVPVPKVIDFGLAKAVHEPLTEQTLHTAHGVLLGTPLYMSPEQAELNNLDVDTRTDVYALGVILYELLTGTTPLEQQRLRQVAWQEMVRLIKEEEPPRPSARLSGSGSLPSVAAQRQLGPVNLTRLVRGELDWIVMKALEKDRNRRYESANSFAVDVQHFLAGEPVLAAPPGAGYRLRKFVRKHRAAVLTGAAFAALLVAGTITSLAFAVQAWRHAEGESRARKEADDNATGQELARREADRNAAGQELARREADRNAAAATAERDRVRRLLFVATMNLASTAHAERRSARLRELLAEARPAPGEEDKRGFEWHYLNRLVEAEPMLLDPGVAPAATRLPTPPAENYGHIGERWLNGTHPFSADGRWLGTLRLGPNPFALVPRQPAKRQELAVLDTRTGKVALRHKLDGAQDLAISSAWAACGDRQSIVFYDLASGRRTGDIKAGQPVVALTCDAAGTRLLTVLGPDHLDKLPAPPRTAITIQVWDVASKKVLFTVPAPEVGHRFHRLFSPDGSRLVTMLTNSRDWPAVGKPREGIIVRDGTTGEKLYEISEPEALVGFTGKDNQLVTASRRTAEGEVDRLVFRETRDRDGKPTRVFPITPVAATALAIRADGRFAAVGQGTGSITLYDLTGGQLPRTLWGHGAAVVRVVFEEGGETLLSYCEKGEVRRHGLSDPEVRQLSGRIITGRPHFSPDGSRVLTEHREGGLSYGLWDSDTAAEVGRVIGEEGGGHLVGDVSMSRDASRVAVCCVQDARFPHHRGRAASQEMLRDGPLFPALLPTGPGDLVANAMSFARFTPGVERIRVWDVAGQRVLFERSRQRGRFAPWVPRLSPDGRHLLLLSDPPPGWTVYDLDTGAATCTGDLLTSGTPPLGNGFVHFAGDRMMIAELGPNGNPTQAVFRWWDLETGKPLATHEASFLDPLWAHFQPAPDGRRVAIHPGLLAAVAQLKTLVFDVTPAGVRRILDVPTGATAFSQDGRKLATAAGQELDVWDLDEPGPPLKLRGLQPGSPYLLAFSPDGRRLVACEARQRLRVWDLTTGRELLALPCPFPAQSMQFVGDRLVVTGGDRLWVLDGTPRDRR